MTGLSAQSTSKNKNYKPPNNIRGSKQDMNGVPYDAMDRIARGKTVYSIRFSSLFRLPAKPQGGEPSEGILFSRQSKCRAHSPKSLSSLALGTLSGGKG